VRRRAVETGERYTAVRSQLEAERRHHDGQWPAVRTFPGRGRGAAMGRPTRRVGVNKVLIPRFQRSKFAPGVVLLQLSPNPELTASNSSRGL
jgi:hypothetical protein